MRRDWVRFSGSQFDWILVRVSRVGTPPMPSEPDRASRGGGSNRGTRGIEKSLVFFRSDREISRTSERGNFVETVIKKPLEVKDRREITIDFPGNPLAESVKVASPALVEGCHQSTGRPIWVRFRESARPTPLGSFCSGSSRKRRHEGRPSCLDGRVLPGSSILPRLPSQLRPRRVTQRGGRRAWRRGGRACRRW